MSAPASTPQAGAPHRTAHGTIVGMPPVVRTPHQLGQHSSITLKSVYSAADVAGPSSDAFHPDRWSTPPPIGLDPIIPCDDPEEEDEAVYVRSNPASAPPSDERTAPSAMVVRVAPTTSASEEVHRVMVGAHQSDPVEEHVPAEPPPSEVAVTVRRPDPVMEEPVRLPFGEKRSESEQRLLLMAALASGATLLTGIVAALIWL